MVAPVKILLFGKNGQVGWELQRSLSPLGKLIALDANSTGLCGDFTNLQGLAETVATVRPNIIVNAAAYTAVDRAESEPELARTINATAPGVLAQEAQRLGAWHIHYSSDYVFDGSGTRASKETDVTVPLGIYGLTKLEGERLVAANCSNHLILRTSWVYAARGNNFAKTMLRLAKQCDSLSVVDDQIGAPTGAELLADVTAQAIYRVLLQPQLAGLYHLTASGQTSWHGYARFVIEYARNAGISLKVGADKVVAISSEAFSAVAKRPHNSRLDTGKLQSAFGFTLPSWQQGVERMLLEIIESNND
jgi:dTDP-4-dehydrorhamnose reductase